MNNPIVEPEKALTFLKTKLIAINKAIEIAETTELYKDKLGDIIVPEYLYSMVTLIEREIQMVEEIIQLRKIIKRLTTN
jgi:hypothetical protein